MDSRSAEVTDTADIADVAPGSRVEGSRTPAQRYTIPPGARAADEPLRTLAPTCSWAQAALALSIGSSTRDALADAGRFIGRQSPICASRRAFARRAHRTGRIEG